MNHRISLLLIIIVIIQAIACHKSPPKIQGDAHKGITKDLLPAHFQELYQVNKGDDTAYLASHLKIYTNYLNQGQKDSALFCLIALHEVLDQNFIYDSNALVLAKSFLSSELNQNTNQNELLKLSYYIASQYLSNDNFDSAIVWFKHGIENSASLPRTKAKCRNLLSTTYAHLNKMDTSILLMQENCSYYQSLNDTINYGISCANLGMKYRYIYAFELAKKHTDEALKMAVIKKDTFTQVMVLHSQGLIIINDKYDSLAFSQNVYRINALMSNFSRPNFTLLYVQAEANLQLYGKRKQLDSMSIWLDRFKEVCFKRGGASISDYYSHKNRYNYIAGLPIEDKSDLQLYAHEQYLDESYKGAYADYTLLQNDAKLQKNWRLVSAYQDTIELINEKLFEASNKGKLYELEIKYQTKIKDQNLQLKDKEIEARNRNIILLLSLLIILILSFLVYFIWQKNKVVSEKRKNETLFTQKLMENTEDERMRIAQDLHDSIGHELLSVKNTLSNKIQLTEDKIDHILTEVREISRNLFPVMFEDVGLKHSLEQLADSFQKKTGLYINTEINYSYQKLPVKYELNIYRIAQEALSNTVKYAQAKSAMLSVTEKPNYVFVEIKDNGIGFDVIEMLKSNKSFGLLSMNQRCKSMGSKIAINANSKGTIISFEIPINSYV